MAANLAFPKEDSDGVLCVVLNTLTKSNSVENHLLTFLSIKYFGISAHKKCNFFHLLNLIRP